MPNVINSKVPAVKFKRRSELAPKGINSEAPAKAKKNPREGISGDFHSQGISKLAPKGINSEVPAVNSYVVYNSDVDPSWRQKESIPRYQRENFAPTELESQI